MKKQYIVPQTEIVNVRMNSSVLGPDEFGNWSNGAGGEFADGKENKAEIEVEEGLINPTQPNLWDDEEE